MASDTKQQILETALDLFAQRGFDAVSVRDIAGRLGITAGALYKHYAGKQDIFDAILLTMEEGDAQKAEEQGVPADSLEATAESQAEYAAVTPAELKAFTLNMVAYWTRDPFASKFRKLLEIERHRDPAYDALYQQYLGTGPLDYVEDILASMDRAGTLACADPHQAALEFYGPVHMAFVLGDALIDPQGLVASHIDRFFETHRGLLS